MKYRITHTLRSGITNKRAYPTRDEAMQDWDNTVEFTVPGEQCWLHELFDNAEPRVVSTYAPVGKLVGVRS